MRFTYRAVSLMSLMMGGVVVGFTMFGEARTAKGQHNFPSPGVHQSADMTSGLSFSPEHIDVTGKVPGVYKMTVILTNRSKTTRKNIVIGGTCACIELINPRHPIELAPGMARKVSFNFSQTRRILVKQALNAGDLHTPGESASLNIDGQLAYIVLHPKLEVTQLDFRRSFQTASPSPATLEVQLHKDVQLLGCEPGISWMDVSVEQKGEKATLKFSALPNAPEGLQDMPFTLIYRVTGNKSIFRSETTVPTRFSTDYSLDRGRLWFGKITKSSSQERFFEVTGTNAARVLRFTSEDKRVTISSSKIESNKVRVRCIVNTSQMNGSFSSEIRCFKNDQLMGSIKVSGFVADSK